MSSTNAQSSRRRGQSNSAFIQQCNKLIVDDELFSQLSRAGEESAIPTRRTFKFKQAQAQTQLSLAGEE